MERINLKHQLRQTLRLQHNVKLTEPQLNTILEIFEQSRRSNILNVAFYRVINMAIGLFGVVFFFLIRETWAERWFFVIFALIFAIYNGIHSFASYFQYKRFQIQNEKANGSGN